MAEVDSRTLSRGNVGGSVVAAKGDFDVRSWQGLTKLLKAGKESGMDPETYARFRDLVLSYAGSGGTDQSLRSKIESLTSSFNVREGVASPPAEQSPVNTPSPAKSPVPEAAHRAEDGGNTAAPKERAVSALGSFGISRPRPSFGALEPRREEKGTVANKVDEVPENLPVANVTPRTVPVREHVPPPKMQAPEKETSQESQKPAAGVPPPPPVQSVDEYNARIAEIKRTVNARVGNPVALIGEGNSVGKEYMTALLAAMKAANSKSVSTLTPAMETLEGVFKKVMNLPGNPTSETAAPAPAPSPTAAPAPKPQVKTSPATSPTPPTPPTTPLDGPVTDTVMRMDSDSGTKTTQPNTAAVPRSEPEAKKAAVANQPAPSAPQPAPKLSSQGPVNPPAPAAPQKENRWHNNQSDNAVPLRSSYTATPHASPAPAGAQRGEHAIPSLATYTGGVKMGKSGAPQNVDSKPPSPASVDTPEEGAAKSQAEEQQIVEAAPAPVAETAPTTTADELQSPEVTEGLHQLLSEWKIFHGSGFLGTGAGGHEHPLYKKLAPLTMSIISSGSWEGAKKEDILSIRDYMGGWLQEQGVTFLEEESFEHYLRRVVKRILKRRAG